MSQLWLQGEKAQVLSIAQDRLDGDPSDLVGLLLKLEYETSFVLLADIEETMNRIEARIPEINTPNFTKERSSLQASIGITRSIIAKVPGDELVAESAKGNISNKPMTYLTVIQALEKDGFVGPGDIPTPLPTTPTTP